MSASSRPDRTYGFPRSRPNAGPGTRTSGSAPSGSPAGRSVRLPSGTSSGGFPARSSSRPPACWRTSLTPPGFPSWSTPPVGRRTGTPLAGQRPVVAFHPDVGPGRPNWIDPVLTELAADGLIEYVSLAGVPHGRLPEVIGSADVVIDEIGPDDYGITAVAAMAAGRCRAGHGLRRRSRARPTHRRAGAADHPGGSGHRARDRAGAS